MQSKISSFWAFFIIGIAVIAFSSIVIFSIPNEQRQIHENLIDGASVASAAMSAFSADASSTVPIRLIIPKINVDAPVEDLSTTSLGAMAVPVGPSDVAWFDLGPRPGDIGSSVIAGHEGWKDGIAAVFDNLHELQKGDDIYVEDASGTITTFIVTRTQLYDQNGNATDIFSSNDGIAHLNLITCEGTWNASEKSYSNRLVVFADEVISTSSSQQL